MRGKIIRVGQNELLCRVPTGTRAIFFPIPLIQLSLQPHTMPLLLHKLKVSIDTIGFILLLDFIRKHLAEAQIRNMH